MTKRKMAVRATVAECVPGNSSARALRTRLSSVSSGRERAHTVHTAHTAQWERSAASRARRGLAGRGQGYDLTEPLTY